MTLTKAALRADMHARRAGLSAAEREGAAKALAAHAGQLLSLAGGVQAPTVSTYWAIGPELVPKPLETALIGRGATLCLPVMAGRAQPLVFRKFGHGDALVERTWGIKEPSELAVVVVPDLLLVPLLAVDLTGARLGYGGGFYDRTLRHLRSTRTIVAVGVAFAVQVVDAVPTETYDERLDWLVTPGGLARCRS